MRPEDFFGNDYDTFLEIDPFNPKNIVGGFISRKANEYYGALIITQINDKSVEPQLIMCTPKIHYPFHENSYGKRSYDFPSAKSIEIYVKLDGTNILSYFYNNGINRYLTFKTRLRPFLSSGRFGDFYSMWREVAEPYFKNIETVMKFLNCNLSFELYGARNPHLIVYKEPLTFALLFGVTNTGNIISPAKINNTALIYNLPEVNLLKTIDRDYVWNYEELQKELDSKLVVNEDNKYIGSEGTVWYLQLIDGKYLQFKCKPETIEAIHFASGSSLGKNTIIATCWNAFENMETPTVEFVKTLLIEEFSASVVEANHNLIVKSLDFVMTESVVRKQILDEYKALNMNILLQKVEVMRTLSKKLPATVMRKAYAVITQNT